jgi:ribosomal-protein-alanine N-acetyltransferase
VQEIFSEWEVVRYLNAIVPWPYPPDGARTFYREVALPGVERGERWEWTLRLKSAPEQILGGIGLMLSEDNNRGFWIGLPWQGQGLMSEACEAVTDFWFNRLRFPRLRVPKAVANREFSLKSLS